MPDWNGKTVSVEAHRIALQIQRVTGLATLPNSFSVADQSRTLLRQLYSATGGRRGTGDGCYNPSSQELRDIYNGKTTGAEVMAKALGGAAPKAAPSATFSAPEGPEAEALAALQKLLGPKVDSDAIKAVALEAVDTRVAEVLSSLAGLVADEVSRSVRTIEVKVADAPAVKVDKAHCLLPRLLRYVANRKSFLLVGPAGSGKTTICEQLATSCGLDFYLSGKCADEVKITGYMDGGGTYRSTQFRQAYEFGGLFLFDEMDGWSADALIAVNAALAGQWGDFPDGKVRRHPDFVAVGAGNTFGRGADRQYVGREQLDAATLDRFAVIVMDYDEDLEMAIAPNKDWTKHVQKIRAAIMGEKIRHLVTPRASIEGGHMLAAGETWAEVEEAYVWKGIEERVKNQVLAAVR